MIVRGITFHVLFLLCSPPRPSFVSVVFIFNALLSDVAPESPILLAVLINIET